MEHRKSGQCPPWMRSIFFEDVPSEAASVESHWHVLHLRLHYRDERSECDWRPMTEASRKEERAMRKKAMRIRLVKHIMMLRVLQNVGVCRHILFKSGLFKCLSCMLLWTMRDNDWRQDVILFWDWYLDVQCVCGVCFCWTNADYLCNHCLFGSLIIYI